MKRPVYNVEYNVLPIVLNLLVTCMVLALAYFNNGPRGSWYSIFLFGCMIVIGLYDLFALVSMPYSILIKNGRILLTSPFGLRRINLSDIKSVAAVDSNSDYGKCKFGSYGLFGGYWGRWHSDVYGDYTAFYGRRDGCFFVRLKNGKGYMLGCKDSDALMQAIKDAMAEQ